MTLALYWPKLARRHIARVMQLRNRFVSGSQSAWKRMP